MFVCLVGWSAGRLVQHFERGRRTEMRAFGHYNGLLYGKVGITLGSFSCRYTTGPGVLCVGPRTPATEQKQRRQSIIIIIIISYSSSSSLPRSRIIIDSTTPHAQDEAAALDLAFLDVGVSRW